MKKFYLMIMFIGLTAGFSISASAQCNGQSACKNTGAKNNTKRTETVGRRINQTQSNAVTFEGNDEPLGSLNRVRRNANRISAGNGRTESVSKNETITVGGNRSVSNRNQSQNIVQNGGQGTKNRRK